jgi:hypothetical protein
MSYADDAIAQIERVTTVAQLDTLGPIVTGAITSQISAAAAAEAVLTPLAALATASFATLPEVVTFLGSLQSTLLGPQVAALADIVALGASAAADLAAVTAAIAAAEARLS